MRRSQGGDGAREGVCVNVRKEKTFLKFKGQKIGSYFVQLDFVLGFHSQCFVSGDILRACDEVIFCVFSGMCPCRCVFGRKTASLSGNVAIKAFLALTEHPSHQPMNRPVKPENCSNVKHAKR